MIQAIKSFVDVVLHPPPSPEAIAAKEQSDRVVKAAEKFVEHQDVFGAMVRKAKGTKQRKSRSRK